MKNEGGRMLEQNTKHKIILTAQDRKELVPLLHITQAE